MFFGYENEAEMRKYNPEIADKIIAAARSSSVTACSEGKRCVGSVDGKTFLYSDGTQDLGREVKEFRAELDGHVFGWMSGR